MKKLKSLDIKGLFGLHDYKIDFEKKNGYTIFAAPNGYGKSTILQILRSIASGNYFFFNELVFTSIHLEYTDVENDKESEVRSLDIVRHPVDSKSANDFMDKMSWNGVDFSEGETPAGGMLQYFIEICYFSPNYSDKAAQGYKSIRFSNRDVYELADIIKEEDTGLKRVYSSNEDEIRFGSSYCTELPYWRYKDDDREMSFAEVFGQYNLSNYFHKPFWEGPFAGYYDLMHSTSFEYLYVDANRTVYTSSNKGKKVNAGTIALLLHDLGKFYYQKAKNISEQNFGRYPQSVLELLNSNPDKEKLRAEVLALMDMYAKMKERGHMYGTFVRGGTYDSYHVSDEIKEKVDKGERIDLGYLSDNCSINTLAFYKVLLDNFIAELSVYNPIVERLEYYHKWLKEFFHSVKIWPTLSGFITDLPEDVALYEEEEWRSYLDLRKLSSGEKHLVMLLGILSVFKNKRAADWNFDYLQKDKFSFFDFLGDALILIDEPEISLHPTWQEKLADFFWDCHKDGGNEFVFATHSPTFVSNRWKNVIELSHL